MLVFHPPPGFWPLPSDFEGGAGSLSSRRDHRGFASHFSAPSVLLFFDSSCILSSVPSLLCSQLSRLLFLCKVCFALSGPTSSLPVPFDLPSCSHLQCPHSSLTLARRQKPWGFPHPVVMVEGKFAAGTHWGHLRSPASTPVFCKAFLLPSQ